MIEDKFLKQIAKDHQKNLLDRDQGKLFLKELMDRECCVDWYELLETFWKISFKDMFPKVM